MKIKGLIAEIGNHHFGDIDKAKELIKAAYESGAHYIKMQMIDPEVVSKFGSMPKEFYEQCALTREQYQHCYDYAEFLGSELFFSYFGEFEPIGRIIKYSASQFNKSEHLIPDEENHIISTNEISRDALKCILGKYQKSSIMVATHYLQSPTNFTQRTLKCFSNMFMGGLCDNSFGEKLDIGLSDHTLGAKNCLYHIKKYDLELIEKHFNIFGMQKFKGIPYRDCFHAANPQELESIARAIRGIA